MPYTIRKIPRRNCYKLMNRRTKHAFSKCTSLSKAKKQLRLLQAIKYNRSFRPIGRTRKNRSG